MKNTQLSALLLLVLLTGCSSCSSSSSSKPVPANVSVSSVSVSPATLNLAPSKTAQLTATVLPPNASNPSVTWSSSDPSIATVANGLVTAIAPGGPLSITATTEDGGKTADCQVSVAVSAVVLSPNALGVPLGRNPIALSAAVVPSTLDQSVTWSSDNPSVATVAAGVVTFVGTGTATITATDSYQASDICTVTVWPAGSTAMRIGTNLWNFGWGNGWADYVAPNLDWGTVTNPWLPAFLTDMAPFSGPIRFMDWGLANGVLVHWSDRMQKTDNHYKGKAVLVDASIAKYFSNPSSTDSSVAYEWMIDLCNRTGKDMWVNVPAFSDTDYWTQLAKLIHDKLDPSLRCYVEYADETWNGGLSVFQYTLDQGVANSFPGTNKWYQGGAWSVWNSLNIFKAFQDVFGADAMGSRVIRVLAFSGNFDIADQAYYNVMYDGTGTTNFSPKWNPNNQKADLLAIAPYFGPSDDAAGTGVLDGADPNIAVRFQANIDWNYVHYISNAIIIAAKYNTPLGCYEGGQQLNTHADQWSSNPAIYDAFAYMLSKWIPANFVMFNHYTLYSTYTSGVAWGAKSSVTTSVDKAPKYRALVDWANSHR
jgi:hypothetical protein